jgi:Flp pilus assembly protein CpaB
MDQSPSPRSRLALTRRRLRRALLIRRRALAAVSAALAVFAGLQAASPRPPETRTVVVAAHDLQAGSVVGPGDLERAAFRPDNVPGGALPHAGAALGRTTTGPVRAGEPITDARLLGGSLLEGYPGRVAAPVRVGDPGAVELLRIGDRVDVIAADPQGGSEPRLVAAGAPVVALPAGQDTALASGGLVVLAVHEDTARALAGAAVSAYLSIVLTR